MLGTDTYFLSADCWSSSSLKANIIKKIIFNVVNTAKYTSDFRIATKPDVYDYEWFSVDTGSKYYFLTRQKMLKLYTKTLCSVSGNGMQRLIALTKCLFLVSQYVLRKIKILLPTVQMKSIRKNSKKR